MSVLRLKEGGRREGGMEGGREGRREGEKEGGREGEIKKKDVLKANLVYIKRLEFLIITKNK